MLSVHRWCLIIWQLLFLFGSEGQRRRFRDARCVLRPWRFAQCKKWLKRGRAPRSLFFLYLTSTADCRLSDAHCFHSTQQGRGDGFETHITSCNCMFDELSTLDDIPKRKQPNSIDSHCLFPLLLTSKTGISSFIWWRRRIIHKSNEFRELCPSINIYWYPLIGAIGDIFE